MASSLSPSQQQALAQVLEFTGNADTDVAVGVLSAVDWDVQRAAEMIFGGGPTPTPAPVPVTPSTPAIMEEFEIDDSEVDLGGPGTPRPTPGHTASLPTLLLRPLLSLLSLPLTLLSSLLRLLLTALRIPLPRALLTNYTPFRGLTFLRFASSANRNGARTHPRNARGGGAERWVRELEEETGAVCLGRAGLGSSSALQTTSTSEGGSSLTNRAGNAVDGMDFGDEEEGGRRMLPDFALCGYEEALRIAQREARIACIVLVSEEHDDVAEFKRTTLTSPTFLRTLHTNNILTWGGDVSSPEAHSAAQKLHATTFPFLAFLALQPPRTPRSHTPSHTPSNSTPPQLTVLSRHAGPSTPSSGPTSAHTLTTHLTTTLLPRITPFLHTIHAQQRTRALERAMREEQDRAFALGAQRDRDRLTQKALEAETARLQQQQEAEAREEAERRRQREEEEEVRRAEERMAWRRWTRRSFAQADANGGGKALRLAIRLPTGQRLVHTFAGDADLTDLYAYIDAQFIPASLPSSEDPSSPPTSVSSPSSTPKAILETYIASAQSASAYWGFTVASSFPRVEIPWEKGVELAGVKALEGGGQVVVEVLNSGRSSPRASLDGKGKEKEEGDDDGYDTEED
ncbi:hypothetical protein DFP72DRAFT_1079270 [Ephemerocybe angulata]|uniref:UBX domain-containing protein n=1 Tax=Ephemerocybe angulata TaxID=980116 RepID=A0A8H6LX72_9AGAR|nr:hypothetical protein DFP72DRAFT_1079270 [Tulosesus angulatus]